MAEQTALATQTQPQPRASILAKFGERYDLDPGKVMNIVAQTVFRTSGNEPPLSPEETAAALIVCNQYDLNPFTKEIYAFRSKGKLLVVVGVDGWSAIVNRQPQLDGIEFEEHFLDNGQVEAVTCKIHRKDRSLPVVVTEYTRECRRDTDPWNKMPVRMTRNRAFVQCARLAFSISGIVDQDEAQTIDGSPEYITGDTKAVIDAAPTRTEAVKSVVRQRSQRASNAHQQAQQEPTDAQNPAHSDSQERTYEPVQEPAEVQPHMASQPEQTTQGASLW